jgi:hypothetical protein
VDQLLRHLLGAGITEERFGQGAKEQGEAAAGWLSTGQNHRSLLAGSGGRSQRTHETGPQAGAGTGTKGKVHHDPPGYRGSTVETRPV